MVLAFQKWNSGLIKETIDLLETYIPAGELPDLRGWEWHLLWRECHPARVTLETGTELCWMVGWSTDDATLFTLDRQDVLKAWDAESGEAIRKMSIGDDVVTRGLSNDGKTAVTMTRDGTVSVWNLTQGTSRVVKLDFDGVGHSIKLFYCDISNDGARFAYSANVNVHVWDLATGRRIGQPLVHPVTRVISVALSSDGQSVAAGTTHGSVTVWNLDTDVQPARFSDHTRRVEIAYSPDGRWLATGGFDKTVIVRKVGSRRQEAKLTVDSPVRSLSLSGNGLLAVGFGDAPAPIGVSVFRLVGQEWTKIKDLRGHTNRVVACRFSGDGQTLATASKDGTARLWDLTPYLSKQQFASPSSEIADAVIAVDISAENAAITVGKDNSVRLWDIASRKESARLNHPGRVFDAASCEDHMVAVAGEPSLLWNAATDTSPVSVSHIGKASSVVWLPETKTRVWGLENQIVVDGPNKDVRHIDVPGSGWIHELSGSDDGLALGALGEGTAFTIDLESNAVVKMQVDSELETCSASMAPAGDRVAIGTFRGARIFDVKSGERLATISGFDPLGAVHVSFAPSGQRLALAGTFGLDTGYRVWNVADDRPTPVGRLILGLHQGPASCVQYTHDGKALLFGFPNGNLATIDVSQPDPNYTPPHVLPGHARDVVAATYSPDGKLLALGREDFTVRIVDAETGELIKTLEGHESAVNATSFSSDGELLASGGSDQRIIVWDVGSWIQKQTLTGHELPVRSLAFSPRGDVLASGDGFVNQHGVAKIWNLSDGSVIETLRSPKIAYGVTKLAFSKQGDRLFVAQDPGWSNLDYALQIWDAQSWSLSSSLRAPGSTIETFALSPDERTLATGGSDGVVRLWDLGSGKLMHAFSGHERYVTTLAYSPDRTRLASGGSDKTVRLWDLNLLRELGTIRKHRAALQVVQFSPDGRTLFSASAGANQPGKVEFFDGSPGR